MTLAGGVVGGVGFGAAAWRLRGGRPGLSASRRDRSRALQGNQGLEARRRRATISPAGRLVEGLPRPRTRHARGAGRDLQPDAQGRRGELSRGAGADRRGARRAFSDSQFQSVDHALGRRLDSFEQPRRRDERHVDARHLGQGAARHRGAGRRARRSAPPTSPTRRYRSNRRSRSPMCSCARPTRSHDLLARHGQAIPALAGDHAEPVQRGDGRASPTSSPRRRWCSPPRRRRSSSASSRAQSEHAIAVLIGRPPAELVDRAHGKLPQGVPGDSRATALDAARASPRHRRRRAHDEGAERGDRRRDRRLLSRHHAERRVRLFRRSVLQPCRPPIRSGPTVCRLHSRCSMAA